MAILLVMLLIGAIRLFLFVLAAAVTTLAIGFQSNKRGYGWFFAAGLILTAAVFVRPVGLLLIYPVTGLLAVGIYWRSKSFSRAMKTSLFFILPWIVFGGAWYARNYGLSGEVFFTNYEGEALFRRLRPVLMAAIQVDLKSASEFITELNADGMRPVEIYLHVLFAHPITFFIETLTGIGRVLLSPGQWHLSFYFPETYLNPFPIEALFLSGQFGLLAEETRDRPLMYAVLIGVVLLHLLLLYAGVVASLFFVKRKTKEQVILSLFLVLICLYFIGITAGFVGQPRFRVPFVPFLALLAATGYGYLTDFMSKPDPKVTWNHA